MAKKGTIADAYVNLIPSAEGFKSGVEKAINEGTSAGAKTASLGIGNIASGFAMGIGQAAFGAVTELGSKVVDVAKSSISSYAEYEQLIGGVETLFGSAAGYVEDYANQAYKSAGISANKYMDTVNSMAAALNQATGDQWWSAKLANQAVIDMADNANKMGTSMAAVQNAYAGFTKQNFTMLDNLKLGYGGTKGEMERLLADATALSGVEYDLNSYADIVKAIHVIQEEMGIAGTTQKEASTTIQGSLAMVQGAWTNLISGIANEDADLGRLFEKLIDSIFGSDGKGGFVGNILPRIEQALQGLSEFIQIGLQRMPEIISTIIPDLANGFKDVILSIFENINENSDEIMGNISEIFKLLIENAMTLLQAAIGSLPMIVQIAIDLILTLVNAIFDVLPDLIPAAVSIVTTLAYGIADAIPELVPTMIDVIVAIADALMDSVPLLVDAALAIVLALVDGIIGNIDQFAMAAMKMSWQLIATFIAFVPQFVLAAVQIVMALVEALVTTLMKMISGDYWNDALNAIVHSFTDIDWDTIGFNMIDGVVQGFKSGWENLKNTAVNMANSLKDLFTNGFEIHSPSKVFRYYGEMIDEGLALGMESGESEFAAQELARNVNNEFKNSVSLADADSEASDNQTMVELLSEQNTLLWQILNKNYGRSDDEIFSSVQRGAKEYLRRTGSYAFGR